LKSDVLQAGNFYRDVFGAEETFRQETDNGKVFRLGFTIGRIGFAISSEDDIEHKRPLLSSIAEDLGSTFVAIILRLKILIIWLVPHRMRVAELQGLMSWTLLRLLPIPSAVTGHWSSGNQLLNALDDFRSRSPVVDEVPRKTA
jgi:hypothetical protein